MQERIVEATHDASSNNSRWPWPMSSFLPTSESSSPFTVAAVVATVIIAVTVLLPHLRQWWARHGRAVTSAWQTHKVTPYGVYTHVGQILGHHVRYLLLLHPLLHGRGDSEETSRHREALVKETHALVRTVLEDTSSSSSSSSSSNDSGVEATAHSSCAKTSTPLESIMVTHSCRTVFDAVIQSLLDEQEALTGHRRLRICCAALHFGSFYRLLVQEKDKHNNACIEFYQVDVHEADCTLDESLIDEEQVKTCHLIMAQHFFGVPFQQDIFFALGRRHNIPVMEDCVQSGSFYGTYKGHPHADVSLWSCGMDKIPSCMGGGVGVFRESVHGKRLSAACHAKHRQYPVDRWYDRCISLLHQTIHVCIANNTGGTLNVLSLAVGWFFAEPGETPQWHKVAHLVRKDKTMTPFQHATVKFRTRPSPYHLRSIQYGLSRGPHYAKVAAHEVSQQQLFLSHIPSRYHTTLFPWLTPTVRTQRVTNRGITTYTWVAVSDPSLVQPFCRFLNDHGIISLVNTTWEKHASTDYPAPGAQSLCDRLVYLPHLNVSSTATVLHVAAVLTEWCEGQQDGVKQQQRVVVGASSSPLTTVASSSESSEASSEVSSTASA